MDTESSVPTGKLAPALETIRRRYSEHLKLRDLAETVHLHPAYFSAVFKQSTGLSPLAYLARYRVRCVEYLLMTTDDPLRRIAISTGFADRSHLARAFRRVTGLSPSDYRRIRHLTRPPGGVGSSTPSPSRAPAPALSALDLYGC